jgi:hypothetical protein
MSRYTILRGIHDGCRRQSRVEPQTVRRQKTDRLVVGHYYLATVLEDCGLVSEACLYRYRPQSGRNCAIQELTGDDINYIYEIYPHDENGDETSGSNGWDHPNASTEDVTDEYFQIENRFFNAPSRTGHFTQRDTMLRLLGRRHLSVAPESRF